MNRSSRECLRLKGIAANKVFLGPRSVSVQLTNLCNLSCRFCQFHGDAEKSDERLRSPREIGMDVFKRLIDDCVLLHVDGVIFSAEGDPLMHNSIVEMSRYVRRKKLALRINSNCATSNAQALKALNLATRINVNLPATNKHDYAKLQSGGEDVFGQVMHNWEVIRRARGPRHYPRMNIVFIINRYNFMDIEKLIDLATKLRADNVQFQIAKVYANTKNLALSKDILKEFTKVLVRVFKNDKTRRLKTNIDEIARLLLSSEFRKDGRDVSFKGHTSRSHYYDRIFEPGFKCFFGWFFARVSLAGEVHYCCHNRQFPVGNIYKSSFKDVWFGKKAMRTRLKLRDHFNSKKKIWSECNICTGTEFNRDIARAVSL